MKIIAKLLQIDEVNQISSSFKKREFVVEFAENPQFTEYLKFELIQDKCDLVTAFSPGQEIEVHFNLKGRKWTDPNGNDKYFNSLQAWKIQSPQPATQDANSSGAPGHDAPPGWLDDESEPPF